VDSFHCSVGQSEGIALDGCHAQLRCFTLSMATEDHLPDSARPTGTDRGDLAGSALTGHGPQTGGAMPVTRLGARFLCRVATPPDWHRRHVAQTFCTRAWPTGCSMNGAITLAQ